MLVMILSMVDTPEEKRKVEKLFEQYNRLMFVIAYRILHHNEDAEDAVFLAWEKIIVHLDKINKIKCKETKSFIVIIVERTAIDLYRKKKKENTVSTDEYDETPFFATKDKSYEKTETTLWIESLPKIYSEVLLLYYINGFSQREIADILSISENTVASRILRAKKMLKEGIRYE